MMRASDAKWSAVLTAASRLGPAEAWRNDLACAVREAASVEFAAVVTCPPGEWRHLQTTTFPTDYAPILERVESRFLPRVQKAGEGWEDAVSRHGLVYAPLEVARDRNLADEMREGLLHPAGLEGFIVTSFVDSAGNLLGLLALGARSDSNMVLDRSSRGLAKLATTAANTLGGALALASGCSRSTQACATTFPTLSPRENQIASLVAEGLRNGNIGARLGIAESTVAVHLKRIYDKLGIGSRVELAVVSQRAGSLESAAARPPG